MGGRILVWLSALVFGLCLVSLPASAVPGAPVAPAPAPAVPASSPVSPPAPPAPLPPSPPPAPAAPPEPRAWILVDADSGRVIDGNNERTRLPPASVIKVFTALIALHYLQPGDGVSVSALAESMPARKINMKAGQQWRFEDTLYALLLVSANDAAVALAEQVGGSLAGFSTLMDETARRLGLEDAPVLADPAGLDDEFSYQGGSLVSARDLAIVTRAALVRPEITTMATQPDYHFVGGDGLPHRLRNHNRLLSLYPGAIGLKTGYTSRARRSLIAVARRDGRTLIAVVLGAPDTYSWAMYQLDRGFASPAPSVRAGGDRLPKVASVKPAVWPLAGSDVAEGDDDGRAAAALTPATGNVPVVDPRAVTALTVGGVPALAVLVRRRRLRRRRCRHLRRRQLPWSAARDGCHDRSQQLDATPAPVLTLDDPAVAVAVPRVIRPRSSRFSRRRCLPRVAFRPR